MNELKPSRLGRDCGFGASALRGLILAAAASLLMSMALGAAVTTAQAQGQPIGTSKKILNLDYDFESPPLLEVATVDSEKGTIQIRAIEGYRFPPAFTEGHYFLLPNFPKDNPTGESPVVYRGQVTEVGETGYVTMQLSPEAANSIQPGDRFHSLVRPENAATKQILAFPHMIREDKAAQDYKKKATEIAKFLEEASGSLSNLKRIGEALSRYEKEQGYLPPAVVHGPDGKPWHSWRVLILPYLGQNDLFEAYDLAKPWNDPQNLELLDRMPDVYRDPSYKDARALYTHYVVVTGERTAFRPEGIRLPNPEVLKTKKPYYELALELRKSLVTMTRIQDSTSQTIAVVPIGPGPKLLWTKPDDLPVSAAEAKLGQPNAIAAPYRYQGVNASPVLLFDGGAKLLRETVEVETMAAMLSISGNETLDSEKVPFLDMPSIFRGQKTLALKFNADGPCYLINDKRGDSAAAANSSKPKTDSAVTTTTFPIRQP